MNRASLGCPNLRSRAFAAEHREALLEAAALEGMSEIDDHHYDWALNRGTS